MRILSKAEELVLLAVWHLKDQAYGVAVRRYIMEMTGEKWSIGAIYVPLDRLTKWDYLRASQGEPSAERGGRSKRYYSITVAGREALESTRAVQDQMWSRVKDLGLKLD